MDISARLEHPNKGIIVEIIAMKTKKLYTSVAVKRPNGVAQQSGNCGGQGGKCRH